jgi:hypothetical protein
MLVRFKHFSNKAKEERIRFSIDLFVRDQLARSLLH